MADRKELDWMMWRIEDSQRTDPPLVNLVRAIQYYNEKYGHIPNRCEMAEGWGSDLVPPQGMVVSHSKSLRPDHLMLTLDPNLNTSLPGKQSR